MNQLEASNMDKRQGQNYTEPSIVEDRKSVGLVHGQLSPLTLLLKNRAIPANEMDGVFGKMTVEICTAQIDDH